MRLGRLGPGRPWASQAHCSRRALLSTRELGQGRRERLGRGPFGNARETACYRAAAAAHWHARHAGAAAPGSAASRFWLIFRRGWGCRLSLACTSLHRLGTSSHAGTALAFLSGSLYTFCKQTGNLNHTLLNRKQRSNWANYMFDFNMFYILLLSAHFGVSSCLTSLAPGNRGTDWIFLKVN